jgi:hypothetical protein
MSLHAGKQILGFLQLPLHESLSSRAGIKTLKTLEITTKYQVNSRRYFQLLSVYGVFLIKSSGCPSPHGKRFGGSLGNTALLPFLIQDGRYQLQKSVKHIFIN